MPKLKPATKARPVAAPGETITTPLFPDPVTGPAAETLLGRLKPRSAAVSILLETRVVDEVERQQGYPRPRSEVQARRRYLRAMLRLIDADDARRLPWLAATNLNDVLQTKARPLIEAELAFLRMPGAVQHRAGHPTTAPHIVSALSALMARPFRLTEKHARMLLHASGTKMYQTDRPRRRPRS